MTSIVIIAHTPIASALLAGVHHVFPDAQQVYTYDVLPADDSDLLVKRILSQLGQELEHSQVLLFSDLIGATPSNIAVRVVQDLREQEREAELLTGTNICMLLSAVRYRDMPLAQLQTKVIEAGQRGMQSIDCDFQAQ